MFYTKAEVEKLEGEEFTAIASSEVEDRHGEVVELQGWQLGNFKKNPILLFNHWADLPIGKATKIWKSKSNGKLMFKGIISDATQTAREIKQLMSEGILNSFSVGFKALDMTDNRFTKQELLEISVVSVPANPEAQTMAYKTLKESGFTNDDMERIGISAGLVEKMDSFESKLEEVSERAELAVKGLKHLDPHLRSNQRVAKDRLYYQKVAVKAADKLVSGDQDVARQAKTIKRAIEKTIVSLKGELNGQN